MAGATASTGASIRRAPARVNQTFDAKVASRDEVVPILAYVAALLRVASKAVDVLLARLDPMASDGTLETRRLEMEGAIDELPVMGQVRLIGGAIIMIAVIVLVLNEVLTINAINNSTGPFSGIIDTLEGTGGAALSLLVVGLLVAAAAAVMRFFDVGF